METKEKLYIFCIIVLIVLLVVSNLEFEKTESQKERKEIYKTTCEHWEICDYFEDFFCPSIDCPLRYQCNIVDKNCEPTILVD